MFKTKLVNSNATTSKSPKLNNVPVNLVDVVITCRQ